MTLRQILEKMYRFPILVIKGYRLDVVGYEKGEPIYGVITL